VTIGPSLVVLRLRSTRDVELELWGARRKRELFEKVFGRDVELIAHVTHPTRADRQPQEGPVTV
jgi:hypothetical protein